MSLKRNRKIEICAPAGSYESLSAALKAGADSVYFGVEYLNMRSRSSANFTLRDLRKIAGICDKSEVNSYLVLNTLLYDVDMPLMRKICDAALKAGVTAVVASDIAAVQYASSIGLQVHMSVQANVCNLEAVKFFSRYADVMVLARELSLSAVEKICKGIRKENIKGPSGNLVRIEIFAHGALCISVSGLCGMSLALYDSSANRGACYQNCRRRYIVRDAETNEELMIDNKFVMSPKDICTVPFIDRILDAGVSVLKLEGRGRSEDYVYTVTKVYREAVDSWRAGNFAKEKVSSWMEELSKVFNRGFWTGGYYLGEKLDIWCGVEGNIASVRKVHIGKVDNYFSKIKVAQLSLYAGALKSGDELLISGETTGAVKFHVGDIRLNGENVKTALKGTVVSIPVPERLRKNDMVYILIPRKFGEKARD